MSILKSILHHYNKTTKSYDTLHPETEVAQVTDWNNGIVNTLASTALGSLVNTLTSDSLLAMMIQKVLTASGVRYSTGTNGYLCLGSFFANIIIQWGLSDHSKSRAVTVTLPLSITTFLQGVVSDTGSGSVSFGIAPNNASSIVVFSQETGVVSRWILLAI